MPAGARAAGSAQVCWLCLPRGAAGAWLLLSLACRQKAQRCALLVRDGVSPPPPG
eukprot:SAG31_NODE_10641_length_1114_cov_1.618719_1_plen_54_part_10